MQGSVRRIERNPASDDPLSNWARLQEDVHAMLAIAIIMLILQFMTFVIWLRRK